MQINSENKRQLQINTHSTFRKAVITEIIMALYAVNYGLQINTYCKQ